MMRFEGELSHISFLDIMKVSRAISTTKPWHKLISDCESHISLFPTCAGSIGLEPDVKVKGKLREKKWNHRCVV